MENTHLLQEKQVVIFSLSREEYGLPITRVQEINRLAPITKLPQTPDFMEGIINLRGRVIPVIDLRKRFSIALAENTEDTRIVIVEIGGQTAGMIVDSVTEVLTLSLASIEQPPASLSLNAKYIDGVGKVGDRLLILLDVDQILTNNEESVLRQIT